MKVSVCMCMCNRMRECRYFCGKARVNHFIVVWKQQLQLIGKEQNSSHSWQNILPVGGHSYTYRMPCLSWIAGKFCYLQSWSVQETLLHNIHCSHSQSPHVLHCWRGQWMPCSQLTQQAESELCLEMTTVLPVWVGREQDQPAVESASTFVIFLHEFHFVFLL